ncbi:MAG: hypothetical protein Q9160_003248 [Pyrenula sp. 1 TL-2023]
MFLLALFLLLSPLTQAGPLNVWPRQNNVTTHLTATTLVINATAGNNQPVTFTPSQVTDTALWTIQSTTIITANGSAETVYPSGYEWAVASSSPGLSIPPIPTNAPYPVLADRTTSLNSRPSTPSTGAISLGTGASSSSPALGTDSGISVLPGTGSSPIGLGTGASSSSLVFGTGSSNSIPLGIRSSSTGLETSPSNSVPFSTGFTGPTNPTTAGGSGAVSSTGPSSNSTTSRNPNSSNGDSTTGRATTGGATTQGQTTLPTNPTFAFPTYNPPSSTIDPPAATSEADHIGPLLVVLWRDRDLIKDNNRKQEYVDNVEKVRDDVTGLFNDLSDKGPSPPSECGKTVARRSLHGRVLARRSPLSGILSTLDSVAKLLSCAAKVVQNLDDKVKIPEPPISEIETLTDMLNDLGNALDNTGQQPSNSPSNSASSTQISQSSESQSSSSSSCSSSAVPVCTQTVSLSTLFSADGSSTTSSVQSITASLCSTITGCDVRPSTATTTSATASTTSTDGFVCDVGCAGTACSTPQPTKRSVVDPIIAQKIARSNKQRSLDPLDNWRGDENAYLPMIIERATSTELDWNVPGIFVISSQQKFDKEAHANYVAGVTGCLVILIVTERGMWMTHIVCLTTLGPAPNIRYTIRLTLIIQIEAAFRDNEVDRRNYATILDTLRNGANRYTKPDTLTGQDDALDLTRDPHIYVMAPTGPNGGGDLYPAQNEEILKILFGDDTPFAGISREPKPYVKPQTASDINRQGAFGKLLIEYDPDQHDEETDKLHDPRQAIWRAWFQQQAVEHTWTACTALQKRQGGGVCLSGSGTGSRFFFFFYLAELDYYLAEQLQRQLQQFNHHYHPHLEPGVQLSSF